MKKSFGQLNRKIERQISHKSVPLNQLQSSHRQEIMSSLCAYRDDIPKNGMSYYHADCQKIRGILFRNSPPPPMSQLIRESLGGFQLSCYSLV
jgi:hypothetical protein